MQDQAVDSPLRASQQMQPNNADAMAQLHASMQLLNNTQTGGAIAALLQNNLDEAFLQEE